MTFASIALAAPPQTLYVPQTIWLKSPVALHFTFTLQYFIIMSLQQWALPQLSELLPLDEAELKQILSYTDSLPDGEVAKHLGDMLGNENPHAHQFIKAYIERRAGMSKQASDTKDEQFVAPPGPPPSYSNGATTNGIGDSKQRTDPSYDTKSDAKNGDSDQHQNGSNGGLPPAYAPPMGRPPPPAPATYATHHHTNAVIEAAAVRARDEVRSENFKKCRLRQLCGLYVLTHVQQEMQQNLQNLQFSYGIYSTDIEPEHETEYPCNCAIHRYQARKWARYPVQEMWSKAVMYPG